MLAQLYPVYQVLPEIIDMYDKNYPWAASYEELSRILGSVLQNHVFQAIGPERKASNLYSSFTLFLDGLDEIPVTAQVDILQTINSLVSLDLANVRVVVSSRPDYTCNQYLNPANNWRCHEIPAEQVERDIRVFAKHEIECHPGLKQLPEDTKENIYKRLSTGAQGMLVHSSICLPFNFLE